MNVGLTAHWSHVGHIGTNNVCFDEWHEMITRNEAQRMCPARHGCLAGDSNQRPSCPSSVCLSVRPSVKIEGGGGRSQSEKRFSNICPFLAWNFFGMTYITYRNVDLVESL